MKFSINWLGDFVKVPQDIKLLTDDLTLAGHLLDKVEKIGQDTVIDLELRGNRADCYSIFGMAREISAIKNLKLKPYSLSTAIKLKNKIKECSLSIKTPLVRRAVMAVIKDVKIKKSPETIRKRLVASGITPVNNIVDLTNYVMLETGEPLHAFDLDKVGDKLEIRLAKEGEKILTFSGETITLSDNDLVWANSTQVLSIAGAIGEKTNSINDSTTNILLEAANYDRASIRKTIHKHNLFTEAGIRHEKELDPNLVTDGVIRFLTLIEKYKWGTVSSEISDYYPKKVNPQKIEYPYMLTKSLGSVDISKGETKKILKNLGFGVEEKDDKTLVIEVPTFRTDVSSPEDICEEIVRIHGYDKIPSSTLALEIPDDITPKFITQELKVKNILTKLGFNEVITLPFVRDYDTNINQILAPKPYQKVLVQNPPNLDMKEMRLSLMPNLMTVAERIINERGEELRLFEVGKIYYKNQGDFHEVRKLGLIYWKKEGNSFPLFKGFIESVLQQLGIKNYLYKESFEIPNLKDSYYISSSDRVIGEGGFIDNLYYTEFDLESTLPIEKELGVGLWPKYPPQIEDITLDFPQNTSIGPVISAIEKAKYVRRVLLIDNYKNAFTIRVIYQDNKKTLVKKEIEESKKSYLTEIKKKYSVKLKE